jgi:hypothetical protein
VDEKWGARNFMASCLSSCAVHGLMLSTVETWGALKFDAPIDFARYPFWNGDCKMDESSTRTILVVNRVAWEYPRWKLFLSLPAFYGFSTTVVKLAWNSSMASIDLE